MVKDGPDENTIIAGLHAARWRVQIADAEAALARADYQHAVKVAHDSGLTWQRIGGALGFTFARARALALKSEGIPT